MRNIFYAFVLVQLCCVNAIAQSGNSNQLVQAVSCSYYVDQGPLDRMSGFGEENLVNGLYSGLAQRYNTFNGIITGVRFWARVPMSIGTAQTVRVIVYQENVGFPGTILGQTTVSVPASNTLMQIDAVLPTMIMVNSNYIISIEPLVPNTDNIWLKHNEEGNASNGYVGDGGNLYLNLVKQGVTWYKNLANGDPSWDYDFLILPIVTLNISSAYSYVPTNLTVAFTNSSTGAATYQWDFGDGNTSVQTSPSHTYLVSGTYPVKLRSFGSDPSCYDSLTQSITVTMTGLNEIAHKSGLQVQYNSENDLLSLKANTNTEVRIYNILGVQTTFFTLMKGVQKEIEMSGLANGIYFISAPAYTYKFIKN